MAIVHYRNQNLELFQTKEKITDDGKFVVKYGMHYIRGNTAPHFSITIDIYERTASGGWRYVGGGADHETVAKQFPELIPLINWHLCDQSGIPMHYIENGTYWWEGWKGLRETHVKKGREEDYRILCKHALLLPEEEIELAQIEDEEALTDFLKTRIPSLIHRFNKVKSDFNIEEINLTGEA